MARPMMLMKESLLEELYNKHIDGVKYNTLITRYDLPMTGPTLRKLIRYYSIMKTTDDGSNTIIRDSLFPEWLIREIQFQDTANWVYRGKMPLGHWERRK